MAEEVIEFERSTGDGWLHPEGVFVGTFVDYDMQKEMPDGSPLPYGPRIRWQFETDAEREDNKPARLSYWTSPKIHEKSHAMKVIKALGIPIPDGDEPVKLRLSDYTGRLKCQLVVVHGKKTDGTEVANIDSLVPMPKGGKKPKPGEPDYDPFVNQ